MCCLVPVTLTFFLTLRYERLETFTGPFVFLLQFGLPWLFFGKFLTAQITQKVVNHSLVDYELGFCTLFSTQRDKNCTSSAVHDTFLFTPLIPLGLEQGFCGPRPCDFFHQNNLTNYKEDFVCKTQAQVWLQTFGTMHELFQIYFKAIYCDQR